jgi:hypothetical protein
MIGRQAYNSLVTPGRTIPWLQDTSSSTANVQERWQAVYRDVIIVDENNLAVGVYNLSQHDLAIASNREDLKLMLLNAAKAVDADADKMPDVWENKFARGIYITPEADVDLDGFSHFQEFAFGSNPANPQVKPALLIETDLAGRYKLRFKRWGGNAVQYFVETGTTLESWELMGPEVGTWVTLNLFDGTGSMETQITSTTLVNSEETRFFRVRALPQP